MSWTLYIYIYINGQQRNGPKIQMFIISPFLCTVPTGNTNACVSFSGIYSGNETKIYKKKKNV